MKALKFEKHEIVTRDNEGDEHGDEVVSAVVDEGTAGQEVFLRDGTARPLRSGEVVVPVGGGKHDVFTAKEWEDMWNDSERVVEHGGALRAEKVADDNDDYKDVADDNDREEFEEWKRQRDADSVNATPQEFTADSNIDEDERPQDTVPSAPKDDVTPAPKPAKKTAATSGKRS